MHKLMFKFNDINIFFNAMLNKLEEKWSQTNLRTSWSSIVEEKKVSLQRGREVWKAFAAKLRVTCSSS